MKKKHIQQVLDMMKDKTIQCITLDDGEDIEINYFNPNVEIDEEIPEMVIAGDYGIIFVDDLGDAVVENNTIKTKEYKITIL